MFIHQPCDAVSTGSGGGGGGGGRWTRRRHLRLEVNTINTDAGVVVVVDVAND